MMRRSLSMAAAAGCCALAGNSAFAVTSHDGMANDWQITQQVENKLARDNPDMVRQVSVATHDGIVTLSGRVDTVAAEQRAVQDAHSADGVTDVRNELRVRM